MRTELLLRQTRRHFPKFNVDQVNIAPIEKGGSDRKFYRVRCSSEQSLILVKYNLEREENRHYVEIAQFLETHGIHAPRIYFHDANEGLIWLEDLGERDLFGYRAEPWLVRRAFYDSGRYFKTELAVIDKLAALPALRDIAEKLAQLPRVLVHRDFQSQNILIRNGQAYLIDFQGMRPGLAQYDLASLLFDPYVDLSDMERGELLDHYCGGKPSPEFLQTLRVCAMQRLMQALGAYGFLGLVKDHRHFLEHIPKAVRSLHEIVREIPGLELFEKILAELE